MPWHEGAKLQLIRRFGPVEQAEIVAEVERLMDRGGVLESVMTPDVPPEMLEQNSQTEEIYVDDFDD